MVRKWLAQEQMFWHHPAANRSWTLVEIDLVCCAIAWCPSRPTTNVMLAGHWRTARMVAHYSAGATAGQGTVARYL